MRVAVVGHTEWVEFVRVERVPIAGEIVRGTPLLEAAAGGGAVAAVQLARLGAECHFFTAFGDDALGHRAHDALTAWGVRVHAVFRAAPQRRALTFIDARRERTILVLGPRMVAHGEDPLPFDELAHCDAVYVTGGDADAVRAARRARLVVATARCLPILREAAIELDALVGSDRDEAERYDDGDLEPRPRVVVRTAGAQGGTYAGIDRVWHAYAPAPATLAGDTYGAGDTFAAGLTFALGRGDSPAAATSFAAVRAAEVLSYQGPYPARA